MQIGLLLLGYIGCVLGAPAPENDYVPTAPVVLKELSASAMIQLLDIPDTVDTVWLQVEEINDLTGNSYEDGFEFGYSPAVDTVYYPELDGGKGNVFRMKVHCTNDGWSQWSANSEEAHSVKSRYELNDLERNWHDAKSFCLSQGKRLAMPKTENQADEMLEQYRSLLEGSDDANTQTAWIGLFDANYNTDDADSSWTWVDGSKLGKFNSFEYGADMGSSVGTSAVGLGLGGYWETDDPVEKHVFFCETLTRGQDQDVEAEYKTGIDSTTILQRAKRG